MDGLKASRYPINSTPYICKVQVELDSDTDYETSQFFKDRLKKM